MKTVLALLSVIIALTAYPATILQEQELHTSVFGAPYTFRGQSFLVEDPFLSSIGVRLQVFNPKFVDSTVNLSVFGGHGNTGPLIAHRSLAPVGYQLGNIIWLDFDVTGVAVAPGETYTFIIEAPNMYWGAKYNQWAYASGLNPEAWAGRIDYPGGEHFSTSGFSHELDLTFRVDTVPEPGIVVLLLAGLAGLWFWRRGLSPQHHH